MSPPTNAEQILKACEEKYKEAMSEGIKGMSDFRERYVDNAKPTDLVKSLHSSYINTISMHCAMGGALSFLVVRTLTSRSPPLPKFAATILFTGLGVYFGGARASTLAYRELVNESMKEVDREEWAQKLACPSANALKECAEDEGCRELMETKVPMGQQLLSCYRSCQGKGGSGAAEGGFEI